ncbi:hypothetical protein DAH51_20435 [Sphingobium yanoikuyae]|jgi:hypothetical protein|uniref:Uncharacterized protein n=2 Tax=Sphingomonadaceae TaxID=41297 RepID=A0A430BN15_SPHYA|nr:hypothetical protein DAH51_20435 [Sphingobium yanoikuyae]
MERTVARFSDYEYLSHCSELGREAPLPSRRTEKRVRMIITLSDLLAGIRDRKVQLGIVDTPECTEAMRNKGCNRTLQKRAMLARINVRARDADVEPLKAYF